jgi:hypothetical protein
MSTADEISQALKRRVIENDRKVREGSTYFAHAQASIDDELRGRFAQSGQSASVTGSSPISYPQQPSTSPSNQMAMMPEEPLIDGRGEGNVLGFEIDRPDAGSPSTPAASGVEGEGGGLPPSSPPNNLKGLKGFRRRV